MKIAIPLYFCIGGTEKVSRNLFDGLVLLDAVRLLPIYNDGSIRDNARAQELFNKYSKQRTLYKISTARDLHGLSVDIIQTFSEGDKNTFVSGFDKTWPSALVVENNVNHKYGSRCDCKIFPTEICRNKYCSLYNRYGEIETRVIPNPIKPPITLDKLINTKKFVYGNLGRATDDVRDDWVLRCFKTLDGEDTLLVIANATDTLKRRAEELKIKNITFIPALYSDYEISAFYNSINVLLHSNPLGESFGNTIAEAMVHGKAVVSHYGTPNWPQAHSEVIGELHTELLVNEFADYVAVAKALLEDPVYYARVCGALTKRAEAFDYKLVAQQFLDTYISLLSRAKFKRSQRKKYRRIGRHV